MTLASSITNGSLINQYNDGIAPDTICHDIKLSNNVNEFSEYDLHAIHCEGSVDVIFFDTR